MALACVATKQVEARASMRRCFFMVFFLRGVDEIEGALSAQ